MRTLMPLILCLLMLAACAENSGVRSPGKLTWQFALLTPDPSPPSAVGVPYDIDLYYNITGKGPYAWSISAGALPPGLTLDPSTTQNSRLHGTPSVSGSWSFTITVDSDVGPVDFPRSMPVLPAGSLLITTHALAYGSAGVNYGVNVTATGGSGVGYTWTVVSGNMPAGLDIDARDETLSWGSFAGSGTLTQSLNQVSGMVASQSQAGVFWVHNEDANFSAIDSAGNVLQEYTLNTTATNIEDIAIGPGNLLYLADVGDPGTSRSDCRIYRVAEPQVPVAPGAPVVVTHDEFWFEYPGGSQDCGTLLVDWENDQLFLVETVDSSSPRIHRFDSPLDPNWTSSSPVQVTQMTSTGTFDTNITGGDTSVDGRRMILRSFNAAREYALPAGAGFNMIFSEQGSAVSVPAGQQHEAICYGLHGDELFTTTELAGQSTAPIHVSSAAPDNGYTTISGLPQNAGTSTIIVRVTDSAGNVAYAQLTITIS